MTDTLEATEVAAAQDFSITDTATTKIDAAYWRGRLVELVDKYKVPGAALGILRDGAITDMAAGVLSVVTGYRSTPDAIFQIGSISKVWTATLIMQLVDEGKLDLDAPVRDVLPDFAVADEEVSAIVTTRHLLTHTSGIDGDVFDDTGRGDDCITRYVGLLAKVGQNHPLGVTFSYCNSGYVTLGAIIEKLTGTTWDKALAERICKPLGLTATVTLPEEVLLHPNAVGHIGGGDEGPVRQAPIGGLPRSVGPAGLINARAHDVLCFARMHLAGGLTPDGRRVLSAESAEAMTQFQTEVPDPYTLGGDSLGTRLDPLRLGTGQGRPADRARRQHRRAVGVPAAAAGGRIRRRPADQWRQCPRPVPRAVRRAFRRAGGRRDSGRPCARGEPADGVGRRMARHLRACLGAHRGAAARR